MSVASILKTDLSSLAIRLVTVDSDDGIRIIEGIEPIAIPDNSEGILGIIGKAILNAGGWIFGIGSWAVSGLASLCVSVFIGSINYLINFNWNATDEQLVNELLSSTGMIGSQIAGAIGNFAGFLFFGSIGTLVAYRFNPLLGVKVLWDEGEEALDELCSNVSTITRNIALFLIKAQVIAAFAAIRWVLKTVLANPNSPLAAWGTKIFGSGFTKAVKNWGEKGSKPWSFSKGTEDFLEWLPDWLEAPIEELIEEFWDAGQEALYIAAGDIDEYIAEQQIEKTFRNGPFETVEVMPNREDPSLKLVFGGPQELLKPAIVQTLATHQMLEDYDIGLSINGLDPLDINYQVVDDEDNIKVTFRFCSNQAPPWGRGKEKSNYKIGQITVPWVKRSKLDWAILKAAIGGANGFSFGSHQYTAHLQNKNGQLIGQIIASGSSETEVQSLLYDLSTLTDCKINTIVRGGLIKYGESGLILYKDPVKVYPVDVTIINNKKIGRLQKGRKTANATYKTNYSVKIDLYQKEAPTNFNDLIAEIFTYD